MKWLIKRWILIRVWRDMGRWFVVVTAGALAGLRKGEIHGAAVLVM